ncbi:MAG: hypothetical protein GY799_30970 [Desulfobulbaceae bacterium]|nr:hypothetical protein [Desulfobulbaceae bacterium]
MSLGTGVQQIQRPGPQRERSTSQSKMQPESCQGSLETPQDIQQYIAVFYNGCRLHSKLDCVSPYDYERQFVEVTEVA